MTCGICGNNDGDADNEMTQLREIGDSDGSLAGAGCTNCSIMLLWRNIFDHFDRFKTTRKG